MPLSDYILSPLFVISRQYFYHNPVLYTVQTTRFRTLLPPTSSSFPLYSYQIGFPNSLPLQTAVFLFVSVNDTTNLICYLVHTFNIVVLPNHVCAFLNPSYGIREFIPTALVYGQASVLHSVKYFFFY